MKNKIALCAFILGAGYFSVSNANNTWFSGTVSSYKVTASCIDILNSSVGLNSVRNYLVVTLATTSNGSVTFQASSELSNFEGILETVEYGYRNGKTVNLQAYQTDVDMPRLHTGSTTTIGSLSYQSQGIANNTSSCGASSGYPFITGYSN